MGILTKAHLPLVSETKATNYLELIKVACILLWYGRQRRLSLF